MLTRRRLTAALGAGLPLLSARAWASDTPLGAPTQTLPDPIVPGLPNEPTDLSTLIQGGLDLQERLTIPVMIGGQGPFEFAVDTGADRSCVSDELAARLALPAGPTVMVHGISGSALTPTVRIPGLTVGDETLKGGVVPTLPRGRLGLDGLLGVDALQNRRLVMNYRDRILELRQPNPLDDYAPTAKSALVPARNRQGLLTVAGARADNVPVEAFVDSGGALSVGNLALAAALGRRNGSWDPLAPQVRMVDVTGEEAVGEVHVVRTLKFGSMRFTDMGLVFCDLHVFDRWGMSDKPAVLVGANALKLFSRIEMDYGRKRIYFQMAADPMIWLADNAVMG
jgi:hypothetical protein